MELSSYRYNSRRRYQPPKKRHSKRLFVMIVCSVFIYSLYAYLAPLPEPKLNLSLPTIPAETTQLVWPANSNAALGTQEDGLFSTKTTSAPQPIASVTKIITALMILKAKPLNKGEAGPSITITQADIDSYQSYISQYGSVANVKLGESLTEYQALQAMLIPSANNIADTLARWAYGSVDEYVKKTNEFLKSLGLSQTIVADASGFNPSSKSTPSDLIRIGQIAMSNEVVKEIVAQKEATIPEAGLIKTTNNLLLDGTAIGIKTGNTTEAGGCLLFATSVKSPTGETKIIIGAVLGEPTKASSMTVSRTLIDSAKTAFKNRTVLVKGQEAGNLKTEWGTEVKVITESPLEVFTWSDQEIKPKPSTERLNSSMKTGEQVSQVIAEDKSVKLVLASDIKPAPIWWRLTHPIR